MEGNEIPHELEVDGVVYVRKTYMTDEVTSGDRRRSLTALRDYLVHELDGHRCPRCAMSQLKTGDTAALVLRLQKILEEIEEIPVVVDGPPTGVTAINEAKSVRNAELRDKLAKNKKAQAAEERRDNPTRRSGGRR